MSHVRNRRGYARFQPKVVAKPMTIDFGGDWKRFTASLPSDCHVLGTVTYRGKTGALVLMKDYRQTYLMVHQGNVSTLDQIAVKQLIRFAEEEKADHLNLIPVDEWERRQRP